MCDSIRHILRLILINNSRSEALRMLNESKLALCYSVARMSRLDKKKTKGIEVLDFQKGQKLKITYKKTITYKDNKNLIFKVCKKM